MEKTKQNQPCTAFSKVEITPAHTSPDPVLGSISKNPTGGRDLAGVADGPWLCGPAPHISPSHWMDPQVFFVAVVRENYPAELATFFLLDYFSASTA